MATSSSSKTKIDAAIRAFLTFADSKPAFFCNTNDDGNFERALTGYRAAQIKLQTQKGQSPWTTLERFRELKAFIKWSYENRLIKHMPRNVDSALKGVKTHKSPNPASLEQIKALWASADDTMKLYLCLALNMGYRQREIAYLDEKRLTDTHIVAPRSKTWTIGKHKLWPVTKKLLHTVKNNKKGLQFTINIDGEKITYTPMLLSKFNYPLMHGERNDAIAQRFARLRRKVRDSGVEVNGPDGKMISFSSFRDTSATLIGGYIREGFTDKDTVSNFLVHKDGSQASHYVGNMDDVNPDAINSDKLDKVIERLEKDIGLKL